MLALKIGLLLQTEAIGPRPAKSIFGSGTGAFCTTVNA